jgi:hypothetical protein
MRHELQEIIILLSFVLGVHLELLLHFAVLNKHIKHRMSSIVSLIKYLLNLLLIALISKSKTVYLMVELELVLIVPLVSVHLEESLQRLRLSF